jgi:hypothetical protein
VKEPVNDPVLYDDVKALKDAVVAKVPDTAVKTGSVSL